MNTSVDTRLLAVWEQRAHIRAEAASLWINQPTDGTPGRFYGPSGKIEVMLSERGVLLALHRRGRNKGNHSASCYLSRPRVYLSAQEGELRDMPNTRYPYTYAADFIRDIPEKTDVIGIGKLGVVLSRADASRIRSAIAKILNIPDEDLAKKLADAFIAEHGE